MNSSSSELDSFLDVVAKVAASVADAPGPLADSRSALAGAGLLDLGRDTADEPDALHWLTHTVRVAAESSPSLAYVLAARYAADLVHGSLGEASEPAFALAVPPSAPVVPTALGPRHVVVLDADAGEARTMAWEDVADSADASPRTGLRLAGLVTLNVPEAAAGEPLASPEALGHWDLLTSAVLIGTARRAVRESETYVVERHQFGVPIGSFAGLRALVADMDLKVKGARALLDAALDRGSTETVSATAGRAAVETCIAAIQAHGGYGYIDEYPLAELLRDAISVQARAGGRRLHIARVAARALGPRDGSPS
ncbi:acyl-CoA dehydrogenase family protein [Nocardioides sp. NPDC023903]|uniref:acyl-CoA dehydrogenase family protein n=1 Tax=Nocardioides sp. NPDC023903 TaxID=3157195 RepID=UPI0033E13562